MNTDRLIRELEIRLADLSEADRKEVRDALREEIARERRWVEPELTVEAERERRVDAETLRDVLEAINRQVRLEDTVEEVLKQLARIVSYDSLPSPSSTRATALRVRAARGRRRRRGWWGRPSRRPRTLRRERWPLSVADVGTRVTAGAHPGRPSLRSWAGMPLLVEGDVIGLLCFGRTQVDPYQDEDLHRVKAVAFSAAAVIRKAQLLEQVRRYARAHGAGRGRGPGSSSAEERPPTSRARSWKRPVSSGATRAASSFCRRAQGPVVGATVGDGLQGLEGRPAPPDLAATAASTPPARCTCGPPARPCAWSFPPSRVFLVPHGDERRLRGDLVLVDPNGESPDDRLMESFASRAAAAYLHALRPRT